MLRMISFSLFVKPDAYERYRVTLYSHVRRLGMPATLSGNALSSMEQPTGSGGDIELCKHSWATQGL
ncbi:MAG: hypothetical protein SGPRY_001775 [Prymnesium sp.]